ncbi:MAG: bifunctional oligoribonuclease/PAP phosphatase NrnA [Lachnospiraceae bacterium]|nr:bifunctional oligoribonuclease/PAP phosphatase NrnA [Lachnospiraceae bacterium]
MDLLKECAGVGSIGISTHIRPDGDAVGSSMALYLYLKKRCPNAEVKLFMETPPDCFRYLKYFGDIDSAYTYDKPFDVFFVLDTVPDRLGEAEKFFDGAKKKINIDHHISNKNGCGDVNVVLPEIGSTSEVLYGLLDDAYLDTDIAVALYTGIIHDTGVFQYSNTTPQTMRVAARLMEFDFPFFKIIEESFYQKTYLQNQILGRALMESIRFMDGRCIVSCVDKRMMQFYNVEPVDLDGIVNQLRNIKGVNCAVFLYETGLMEYKVSMRSDEMVDVSKVAAYFGGGGHMRAAGCTMKGTVHDVINNLSLHIEKQLKEKEVCTTES